MRNFIAVKEVVDAVLGLGPITVILSADSEKEGKTLTLAFYSTRFDSSRDIEERIEKLIIATKKAAVEDGYERLILRAGGKEVDNAKEIINRLTL